MPLKEELEKMHRAMIDHRLRCEVCDRGEFCPESARLDDEFNALSRLIEVLGDV